MKKKGKAESKNIVLVILFWFLILFVSSIFFSLIIDFLVSTESLQNYYKNSENEESFLKELGISLTCLASIATMAIAIGAYTQLRSLKESSKNTGKTLRMDFVRHLDKQWCSKENTEIRCKLWKIYREKQLSEPKKDAIEAVGKAILRDDKENERHPNHVNTKTLFEHLNFLELMGSIYLYKRNDIIDDGMLQKLFAGKLHTYLKFYRIYLNERPKNEPYALKLLEDLDKLEAEKKV